jgi:hypothetical protein
MTDNQALSWLLRHVKEFGRIGRWLLRLAPFKFKVCHVSGKNNVVADCLTRQYEDLIENPSFAFILQQLPAAFQSIKKYQSEDVFCEDTRLKVENGDTSVRSYRLHNGVLVYHPAKTNVKRYVVPVSLRSTVLDYYHNSTLSAHFGVNKTLKRISKVYYWPKIRNDVIRYVRQCLECLQAKPAQNTRVGMHQARVVTRPLEKVFVDFVGPMVRTRAGNQTIFVILDGFSKFVAMYPVRRITSKVVVDILLKRYFPTFGLPKILVSDNAAVFRSRLFYNTCFSWGVRHVTTSPY